MQSYFKNSKITGLTYSSAQNPNKISGVGYLSGEGFFTPFNKKKKLSKPELHVS